MRDREGRAGSYILYERYVVSARSSGLNGSMPSPTLPRTFPLLSRALRALDCREGSTLVGYSSLALLVAIAALTLLAGPDGAPAMRAHPVAASD